MEDVPYAIVAISIFWFLLVMGFIMFICRLRMRRASDTYHQNESSSCTSSSVHPSPQRIIQIYYVGNCDSSSVSTAIPGNLLSKVLARIEDNPPSYEEVSSLSNRVVVNSTSSAEDDGLSPVPGVQQTTSSAHLPTDTSTNQIRIGSNVGHNHETVSGS